MRKLILLVLILILVTLVGCSGCDGTANYNTVKVKYYEDIVVKTGTTENFVVIRKNGQVRLVQTVALFTKITSDELVAELPKCGDIGE